MSIIAMVAKQLGLLHELVPKADVVAVLRNPNQPELEYEMRDAEEAGRIIGRKILIVKAAGEAEFNAAFATIVQAGAGALLVRGDLSSSTGAGFWSRLPTATPCRRAM